MSLTLYSHPLASFCHKVLIALYEKQIPFEQVVVDLGNPGIAARFRKISPMGKMPALIDNERNRTLGETTIILEYLEDRFSEASPLLPQTDPHRLEARYWDRFFDFHVELPMQKIVGDQLRPADQRDAYGVDEAHRQLRDAYAVIDRALDGRQWAAGDSFTIADCSAAPALFYANTVEPIDTALTTAHGYWRRLMQRPSYRRVLAEAEPYFSYFPMPQKLDIAVTQEVLA